MRVTSAGTGGWHAGDPADHRASQVLRGHGYPTVHRAAQVDDDHLAADLVVAMGRNHVRMLRELGCAADRVRMLRSFDPRSGAHALDVEDPYYGDHDDFEEVFTVIDGVAARPARLGRRAARRPGNRELMRTLGRFCCGRRWLALVRRRDRVRLPVLHGAGAVAARQEHQDSRGRTPRSPTPLSADPVPVTTLLPQQDSSAPERQWRRVTATGRYLPEAQVLARLRVVDGEPAFEVLVPFAVDGGPTVLVDRGYVRPDAGLAVPAIAPPPTGTVTITARLRDSEPLAQGKEPFRQDGVQQVYSINTDADRRR